MHISKYNFARLRIGMLITSVDFGGLEKVVIELLENIEKDSFEVVPLLFIAKRKNQNAFVSYLQKSGQSYFPIVVDRCRQQPTVVGRDLPSEQGVNLLGGLARHLGQPLGQLTASVSGLEISECDLWFEPLLGTDQSYC